MISIQILLHINKTPNDILSTLSEHELTNRIPFIFVNAKIS